MYIDRSPPPYKKYNSGGSAFSKVKQNYRNFKLTNMTLSNSSSTTPLLSNSNNLNDSQKYHSHYHSHSHNHHHHHTHSQQSSNNTRMSSAIASSFGNKRSKKHWGTRERSGMSFLIVIAFFAVFGMIILTEVFMIDERSHGNLMAVRHGSSYGGRFSDSMPDYDNVKDDYDLLDENILSDNKLGFITFRDNKLKIQDADSNDAGRYAGMLLNSGSNGFGGNGGGAGGGGGTFGANANIPWGKVLPSKVEETLPRYPIGIEPTDGSWQVVNGTRFKFFVFSAYYDRRDNAKLVRVVGATKTRSPERVWCRFWYVQRNGSESDGHHHIRYNSVTVMARTKIIRENWNLKYSACFVLCPVRQPEIQVPQYISIVARLRAPPGNILELRNTDWDKDFVALRQKANKQNNTTLNATSSGILTSLSSSAIGGVAASASAAVIKAAKLKAELMRNTDSILPLSDQIADTMAVCVKPFHFNYDQSIYLMEYLEFYAILGVTHFTFYNHTLGPHATCVLKHYMDGDIPSTLSYLNETDGAKAEATVIKQDKSTNYNGKNNNNAHTTFAQPQTQENPVQNQQRKEHPTKNDNQKLPEQTKPHDDEEQKEQQQPKKSSPHHFIKPTINILPWNLRMRSQKEIRTEGLFAALNDCLYRSMYRYKYVALVDLDEFIVPRRTDTLNELITSLSRRFRNQYTGAYSFQNAFFYLQFADDTSANQPMESGGSSRVRAALVTQRKTKRRYKLHPQKQRSKYICRPEYVVEAGNHFVWEFSPGRGSLNVPPQEAILQHYRVCEFGGNDCIKGPSVVDRTATKYVDRLVQRVDVVYRHLKKKCDLPELPILPAETTKTQNNNDLKTKMNKIKKDNNDNMESQPIKTTTTQNKDNKISVNNHDNTEKNFHINNFNNNFKSNNIDNKIRNNQKNFTTGTTTPNQTNNAQKKSTKKKRKMIVFENNEFGEPIVKVEYV